MARGRDRREPYSYLHPGTIVEGDVRAERLRVDGTVRGSVVVEGVLEVAPGGRVEGGPVHAHDVRIAGAVRADVRAEGTVEVWRDGLLEGDVRAGALDVDEGGRFLGRSLSLDEPDGPDAAALSAGPGSGAPEADC
jgi:cytoskeletal protein CcmA (bactofilin family)